MSTLHRDAFILAIPLYAHNYLALIKAYLHSIIGIRVDQTK